MPPKTPSVGRRTNLLYQSVVGCKVIGRVLVVEMQSKDHRTWLGRDTDGRALSMVVPLTGSRPPFQLYAAPRLPHLSFGKPFISVFFGIFPFSLTTLTVSSAATFRIVTIH